MNRHLTLVVVAILLWVVPASALKRFQQPSRMYAAATRVYNIPPSSDRKYVGLHSTFTREAWPGLTVLSAGVTAVEITLLVPVGHGDLHFPTTAMIEAVDGRTPDPAIPVSGPVRVRITNPDGTAENVRLLARAGDALAVERGFRTTPRELNAGASVHLLGALRWMFQATQDGVTWTNAGAAQAPGGTVFRDDGTLVLSSGADFFSRDGVTGEPIAEPGDTRVVVTNLISLRTAITLEMMETTDPAAAGR